MPVSNDKSDADTQKSKSAWGLKLFFATLVGLLVFFYWLLIYSGGVVPHHG